MYMSYGYTKYGYTKYLIMPLCLWREQTEKIRAFEEVVNLNTYGHHRSLENQRAEDWPER